MPNTSSLDLTSVQALRDYVEDFSDQLITQAFFGHETAKISTPHEGVKGELILTSLAVGQLAQRWAKSFNPQGDKIALKPKKLRVQRAKVEIEIYPQDFETSYLGKKRAQGQGMDIPFEGEIMQAVMGRLSQELDNAHMNGVAPTTVGANDPLAQMFDGILALVVQLQAEGHTPLTLPTAGFTVDTALDIVEDLIASLDVPYQLGELEVFMNPAKARIYQNAYAKKYFGSKLNRTNDGATRCLELEEGAGFIKILPSYHSNRIIATPKGNLHHGFDSLSDMAFNFEKVKRHIDFWMDFNFGVQIFMPEEGAFAFTA